MGDILIKYEVIDDVDDEVDEYDKSMMMMMCKKMRICV